MCEQITREDAYNKIQIIHIASMTREQRIDCCLHWVGTKKEDQDYPMLVEKMVDICENGTAEGRKMLYDLLKSAVIYKLVGTTNEYLARLLENQYEVIGEIEQLGKCNCCCYLTFIDTSVEEICPICGWSEQLIEHGDLLLEIAQERYYERGHILKYLTQREKELNTIKYLK
ncbi:hypothetical protein ACWG0P_05585 [Amedibacillus sp. YH-ame6]